MSRKSEKARKREMAEQAKRGTLPIPHREQTGLVTYDATNLQPAHLDQAREFATGLADRMVGAEQPVQA